MEVPFDLLKPRRSHEVADRVTGIDTAGCRLGGVFGKKQSRDLDQLNDVKSSDGCGQSVVELM